MVDPEKRGRGRPKWAAYYRWTGKRPPRELLGRALDHIQWEGGRRKRRTAVELGFGAGTDTLELLERGWSVVAVDREAAAADFLARRVPRRLRPFLTTVTAPMEELRIPRADLVYASYSLPFCVPAQFPALWRSIRRALPPGGHFAGQLFGEKDEWHGRRLMTFHSLRDIRTLTRGYKVELVRETVEDGQSFDGPKHWHFWDLILERS
ncbi:MAG: class I SAM-dependent methyltransferase [Thermoplasmata archaeon]